MVKPGLWVAKEMFRGETRCVGTDFTLQSVVACFGLLPPPRGVRKLWSLLFSLPGPTNYPLGKRLSFGHLGKFRKECVDCSTPGIYTIVGIQD